MRRCALVKDMIRKADVMIENFARGAIERLGLSYDVVKAINPSIIYAQVKGFGEGSPFEHNPAVPTAPAWRQRAGIGISRTLALVPGANPQLVRPGPAA